MIDSIDGLCGQMGARQILPGQTSLSTFHKTWSPLTDDRFDRYFPSGYVLAGNASIPYWATLNRKLICFPSTCIVGINDFTAANWSYQTFSIDEAENIYNQSMLV